MSKRKSNSIMYRSTKVIACAILALVLLSSLAVGGIYARYVKESRVEGTVSSPNFYFTSDILREDADTFTLNPGEGGTTQISFEVRNCADALRVSESDIAVTIDVVCLEPVGGSTEGVAVAVEKNKLLSSVADAAGVTVSGLKNGCTYLIRASGDGGFISTLSAIVVVKPDLAEAFMHVDSSDPYYVLLTVWTSNLVGDSEIYFPAGLIPDATDPVMSAIYNYEGGAYVAADFTDEVNFTSPYSSHVYRFFKSPGESDNFTVKVGGVMATPSIPK